MSYPPPNKHPLSVTADQGLADTNPVGRVGTTTPQRGMLVPKKGKGGVEPATAVHRANIQERMGSQLRIEVKLPGPQAPEAGNTQANGRIIRSRPGQRGNFSEETMQP